MRRKTLPSFNHQLTFANRRPKRRWLTVLGLALVAGAIAYGVSQELRRPPPEVTPPPAPVAAAPEVAPEPPPPPVNRVNIEYVVRPNDTLGLIFRQLNLNIADLPVILGVPVVRDSFRLLKPGDTLMFTLENDVLRGIGRRVGDNEMLSIQRGDEGGFKAEIVRVPIEVRTVQVRGTVSAAFFVPGRAAGLAPELMQRLADEIFGWDIDFAREVRAGDRFNVVYEQRYRDGEYVGDGRIVAAELVVDGRAHRAVRYTSPDGKIDGYFTPDARSVRRQFLRAPLGSVRARASAGSDETRVSLLRDHDGIDYAVPLGTPVKAVADGRVRSAGANGDYGNAIVVDHGGGVTTLYAHLSGFARDFKSNPVVKQGEIIGHVGYTGAAAAPHLHFEYRVNGSHTDPRTVEQPAGAELPATYLPDFQSKSAALLAALDQAGDVVITAALQN